MRYGDIQDTRRPEAMKDMKKEKLRRLCEWRAQKLSSLHSGRKMINILGVTFTI